MADDQAEPYRYPTGPQLIRAAQSRLGIQVQVRDQNLWESAVARPQASAFGADAYPSGWQKAAALMHGIAANHPLVDANKRTSWIAANELLEMNGQTLRHVSEREAERITGAVGRGQLNDVDSLAQVLQSAARRSAPVEPGRATARPTDRAVNRQADRSTGLDR